MFGLPAPLTPTRSLTETKSLLKMKVCSVVWDQTVQGDPDPGLPTQPTAAGTQSNPVMYQ